MLQGWGWGAGEGIMSARLERHVEAGWQRTLRSCPPD